MKKAVAKVAAFKGDKFLMGKRRDNGKWSCPGGHLDKGESPTAAAVRELEEETGLEVIGMLQPLDRKAVKSGDVIVHAFRADVDGEPRTTFDPDEEYSEVRWLDPMKMPRAVLSNLHSDPDVVLEALAATGEPWATFDTEAA